MPEPYYATPDDLRAALGLGIGALSDADATRILEDAEDWVDRMAGPVQVDLTTGRVYTVGILQPFQTDKLREATLELAACLQRNPKALTRAAYARVRGPDFEQMLPHFGGMPADGTYSLQRAVSLLDRGNLRRLVARVR